MAGSISWLSIMPLDVIKSHQQADTHKNRSVKLLFKNILEKEGIRGLFKGTSPVLIRGFIVNAVTLTVYVQTLHFLDIF
jgi:solute carrier family 25 carnitine/acylcarnitine transporter 20/29